MVGWVVGWVVVCGQAREASVPAEEFAGCWRDVADATRFLELEQGRMRELSAHGVELTRTIYDVDHLLRCVWGRRERWELSFDGERLVVDHGEVRRTFERAPERPAALDPTPLTLGAPAALPAERIAALQAELARRLEEDQAVRTGAALDPERGAAVDAANTARLRELVAEVGWIDSPRFGADAAKAAFLIVQHSGDLPLMLAALPPIEADVRENGIDAQNFALLFDRLRVRMGEKQRYGSQLGQDEQGRLCVIALEERERVEELRREIGILSLKQYLGFFTQGGKEVVFEDDRLD